MIVTIALNRSMPNQWARSQLSMSTGTSYHCHKLLIDQCQTNGHDPSYQCQRGPNYFQHLNQSGVSNN